MIALTVFAVLALSACADRSDDADPSDLIPDFPSEPASPPLEPEAIEDPESAAVAAYERYWAPITAAFAAPDGDFSEFSAVAGGTALDYAIAIEQRGIDEGVHGAGAMSHQITVEDELVSDAATQFVLSDCADSSGTTVLDAEGQPVAGEAYGPSRIQARVELVEGQWLVTVIAVQELGSC